MKNWIKSIFCRLFSGVLEEFRMEAKNLISYHLNRFLETLERHEQYLKSDFQRIEALEEKAEETDENDGAESD